MSNTTPRPWRIGNSPKPGGFLQVEVGSVCIAKLPRGFRDLEQQEANAALIVRAVNTYDQDQKVIEAMREALAPFAAVADAIESSTGQRDDDGWWLWVQTTAGKDIGIRGSDVRRARSALALANGDTNATP